MKERLTGAIIVVALLVLLVPELLTGPESYQAAKPAGAEGAQFRSYTIDLQDDAASRNPPSVPATAAVDDPVGQATPEGELDGQSPPVAEVAPPADDAARSAGRPMGSGADASAAAAQDEAPVANAKPGAAMSPGATSPSAEDDKPRSAFGPNAVTRTPPPERSAGSAATPGSAKADTAKASDAAKADVSRAAAAKADAAKADAVKADAARIAAAKAEAQKAEAAKAEAARAAAAKAEAQKVEAARVAAAKETAKPEASRLAAAKPGSKGWAVQLGVFGSRDNAERLSKQVKGSGFPVIVSETSGKDGKKLYWVRVGPEAEQAAATALSAKLKAAGHKDARVVSYP